MYYSRYQLIFVNCLKNGPKNEDLPCFYSLGRIRVSSLRQRGSVGQKVSIEGFQDKVGYLGGVADSNVTLAFEDAHVTNTELS